VNDLKNITANTRQKISSYKIFSKQESKIYAQLIKFGCLGYGITPYVGSSLWNGRNQLQGSDVGYAKNHPGETYQMYPANKHLVVESRNVTWYDWTHPDPNQDVSFFVEEPTTLAKLPEINDQGNHQLQLKS
jgi:hypothetical protein